MAAQTGRHCRKAKASENERSGWYQAGPELELQVDNVLVYLHTRYNRFRNISGQKVDHCYCYFELEHGYKRAVNMCEIHIQIK